jgi:uncharacterized membrane protein YqjE
MPPGPERAPVQDEAATTLSEDLRLVVGEARAYAEAELAWQKARAAHAGKQAGAIGALAGIALLLATLALLALVVGLLLALAPLIGPWGALGAVTGALLLVALVCAGLAAARGRRLARDIADRPEP